MKLKVKNLPPSAGSDNNSITKIKVTGNVISTVNYRHLPTRQGIIKLDKDRYIKKLIVNKDTGEIKSQIFFFNHTKNRSEGYNNLLRSFEKLRDLINCNVTNIDNIHWCTLTYKDNITDTKLLYQDFEKFRKRLNRFCNKNFNEVPKYIAVPEPQERGAWHLHLLLIWNQTKPFIAHSAFWELWSPCIDLTFNFDTSKGTETISINNVREQKNFVKIQSLYKDGKAIDNVGAYLTSYLTDTLDSDHARKKHNRLHLYPTGMQIVRHSRNLKLPEIEYTTEKIAKEKVSSAKLTYQVRKQIHNEETGFTNEITYKYYNTIKE